MLRVFGRFVVTKLVYTLYLGCFVSKFSLDLDVLVLISMEQISFIFGDRQLYIYFVEGLFYFF